MGVQKLEPLETPLAEVTVSEGAVGRRTFGVRVTEDVDRAKLLNPALLSLQRMSKRLKHVFRQPLIVPQFFCETAFSRLFLRERSRPWVLCERVHPFSLGVG